MLSRSIMLCCVVALILSTLVGLYVYDQRNTIRADIGQIAVNSDGTVLAAATQIGIQLWRLPERTHITTLASSCGLLAWSPNQHYFATCDNDNNGSFAIWDATTNRLHATLIGLRATTSHLSFSPDSALLATASSDSLVRIWRVEDGKLLYTFSHKYEVVEDVIFSPDGNFIISTDGEVNIWQLDNARRVYWLDQYYGAITSIAISPNGRLLAFGNSGGLIRLWNIPQRKLEYEVQAHNGNISSLSFSPDNNYLASAPGWKNDQTPANGNISVWNMCAGTRTQRFESHHTVITTVVFSGNSHQLISSGMDGTIQFWTIPEQQAAETSSCNSSAT